MPSGPTALRLSLCQAPRIQPRPSQPSSGDAGGSFDGIHPWWLAFPHLPSGLLPTRHNCFSVRLGQRWCRFYLCAVKGDLSSTEQRPAGTSEVPAAHLEINPTPSPAGLLCLPCQAHQGISSLKNTVEQEP